MTAINILDHYWIIGGSTTDVYSSATNTMVPIGDPGYVAWSANNAASPIASEAELAVVLQSHGSQLPAWIFNAPSFIQPTATMYTTAQLAAYNADARYRKATGGIMVTSIGGSVPFLTDPISRNTINSAWDYMNAKGTGNTINWKMSDGSFITMSTTQMNTLMNDVSEFVQACFSKESTNLMGINEGSITTLAAIDGTYASISNVYP